MYQADLADAMQTPGNSAHINITSRDPLHTPGSWHVHRALRATRAASDRFSIGFSILFVRMRTSATRKCKDMPEKSYYSRPLDLFACSRVRDFT
jgi:hypothetical protein